MLGHSVLLRPIHFNMGRKAANNNKRESEREAEREKVFWSQRVFGDKKERQSLVVRNLDLAVMQNLIKKEKTAERHQEGVSVDLCHG